MKLNKFTQFYLKYEFLIGLESSENENIHFKYTMMTSYFEVIKHLTEQMRDGIFKRKHLQWCLYGLLKYELWFLS